MDNNWISTRTRPPKPGEEVICCIVNLPLLQEDNSEECRFIDKLRYIKEENGEHVFEFRQGICLDREKYMVTHWMHFPGFPSNIDIGDEVQYKNNPEDKFFVTCVYDQYCEGIYANGEVIDAASLNFLEKTGKTSPELISFLKEETANEP